MCTEIWTWNELLAFDVEQPDFGVGKFLAQAHGRIHGVSLFLSAPDFVLQHHGLEHEEILPTTLFEAVYAALRKCLESNRPVITATDTPLRVMRMQDANGHWELGLVSRSHRYLAPQFHFRQPPEKVRKISGFPVADFKAAPDGLRNDFNGALPRIPPYGVLVFECN